MLPRRPRRATAGLLLAGSVLAVIATPWLLGTVDYYRATLFNSVLRNTIVEWRPPTPSLVLLPFFVLCAGSLWLLGRCHRRVAWFDRLALVVLLALALTSRRNIPWLVLGLVPLLAPALDQVLPRWSRPVRGRLNVTFSLVAGAFAAVVLLGAALRSENSYMAPWSDRAAAAVAGAARADPSARIYSNELYADWLLTTHPELAGRIAYDARFELLSRKQLIAVFTWRNEYGEQWASAAEGARIIVLSLPSEAGVVHTLVKPGVRVLYRDDAIEVLLRPMNRS